MAEKMRNRFDEASSSLLIETERQHQIMLQQSLEKITADAQSFQHWSQHYQFPSEPSYCFDIPLIGDKKFDQIFMSATTSTIIYKVYNRLISVRQSGVKEISPIGGVYVYASDDRVLVDTGTGFVLYDHDLTEIRRVSAHDYAYPVLCADGTIYCPTRGRLITVYDKDGIETPERVIEYHYPTTERGHLASITAQHDNYVECYDFDGVNKCSIRNSYKSVKLWCDKILMLTHNNLLIYSLGGILMQTIPLSASNITCDIYNVYYLSNGRLHKLDI